jgi:hypothetical protein
MVVAYAEHASPYPVSHDIVPSLSASIPGSITVNGLLFSLIWSKTFPGEGL